MLKCPYCYEKMEEKSTRCPHCLQYIIDDLINVDFPSINKKDCILCGKQIAKEAKFCKHCRKWLDEINQAARDLDLDDLYEE